MSIDNLFHFLCSGQSDDYIFQREVLCVIAAGTLTVEQTVILARKTLERLAVRERRVS